MNNTIQINRESAPMEALATAAGHVVLKLFTTRINIVMGAMALVMLCWLISGTHTTVTAMCVLAWALHLAVTLTIDIAKGGAEL